MGSEYIDCEDCFLNDTCDRGHCQYDEDLVDEDLFLGDIQ